MAICVSSGEMLAVLDVSHILNSLETARPRVRTSRPGLTARSANASKEDFGGGLDERVWALERQLHDAPASGAVGLAIKGYMIAYHEAGDISRGAEPGALTAFDPDDSYAPNGTLQLGKRALNLTESESRKI
jgi:hypothetical protein